MVCAQKGYPLVVTMAESFCVERRRLMRFLGAKVILTPAAAARHRHGQQGQRTGGAARLVPDPPVRERGQCRLCTRAPPRRRSSTTSTASGSTTGSPASAPAARSRASRACWRRSGPETKIVVCEPDDAPMLSSGHAQARNADGSPAASHPAWKPHPHAGLEPGLHPQARPATPSTPAAIDQVLRITGSRRHAAAASELASKEGIFVGISSGATFAGALRVAAEAARTARPSCACCPTPASATSAPRSSPTSRPT